VLFRSEIGGAPVNAQKLAFVWAASEFQDILHPSQIEISAPKKDWIEKRFAFGGEHRGWYLWRVDIKPVPHRLYLSVEPRSSHPKSFLYVTKAGQLDAAIRSTEWPWAVWITNGQVVAAKSLDTSWKSYDAKRDDIVGLSPPIISERSAYKWRDHRQQILKSPLSELYLEVKANREREEGIIKEIRDAIQAGTILFPFYYVKKPDYLSEDRSSPIAKILRDYRALGTRLDIKTAMDTLKNIHDPYQVSSKRMDALQVFGALRERLRVVDRQRHDEHVRRDKIAEYFKLNSKRMAHRRAVELKQVVPQMVSEEVLLAWGYPSDKDRTVREDGSVERWWYKSRNITVTLTDGHVEVIYEH